MEEKERTQGDAVQPNTLGLVGLGVNEHERVGEITKWVVSRLHGLE